MKCFFTLLSISAAAVMLAGAGQAEPIDLGTIEVLANRSATDDAKVGSTVNKVSSQEIKSKSQPAITDYLATLPGVSVSSPGGVGQETTLIVRGADKKYVKTLVNGIDISDVTATQVQPSIEHFLADGVSEIEVVKGSQGTLYGSDAVAGVIGISTLGEPEEGLHAEWGAEAGSFSTFRSHAKVTAAGNGGKMALSLSGMNTDGISAAEEHAGNHERDGYENLGLTFAGEQQMNDTLTLFASAVAITSASDYDSYAWTAPYQPVDDAVNRSEGNRMGARAGARLNTFDGRLEHTVSAQHFETTRDNYELFGTYSYSGQRDKIDYQATLNASGALKLLGGADYEWQGAEATTPWSTLDGRAWNRGVWAEAILTPVAGLSLTASTRLDDHKTFGSHTSWRTTAAYLFTSGTRLHGSLGTGFRAPSLYELYDPQYGNTGLKPEKSLSWDAGLGQSLLDGRLTLDATLFRLDTKDLIDWVFVGVDPFGNYLGQYQQVPGKTTRHGVELSANWQATDWLTLTSSYTYTRAEDASGARRPRVPKHDVALAAIVTPADQWTVSATAHYVNDTTDVMSGAPVKLDNYFLLNAKVAYQLADNMEVYVRGENLLNQDYQVIKGFGTPDISAYGGLTVKF